MVLWNEQTEGYTTLIRWLGYVCMQCISHLFWIYCAYSIYRYADVYIHISFKSVFFVCVWMKCFSFSFVNFAVIFVLQERCVNYVIHSKPIAYVIHSKPMPTEGSCATLGLPAGNASTRVARLTFLGKACWPKKIIWAFGLFLASSEVGLS